MSSLVGLSLGAGKETLTSCDPAASFPLTADLVLLTGVGHRQNHQTNTTFIWRGCWLTEVCCILSSPLAMSIKAVIKFPKSMSTGETDLTYRITIFLLSLAVLTKAVIGKDAQIYVHGSLVLFSAWLPRRV